MNVSTPLDSLPCINWDDGSIKRSAVDAQLSMARRSSMLNVGIGGEVAGFGFQVLGRMSYVYAVETTNIITFSRAVGFDENWSPYEVLDSGKTIVIERIPKGAHRNVLFDVGASLSYSLYADLASLPMVFTLQPYVLLPLAKVHVNFTTIERIQYGCALFVGVKL